MRHRADRPALHEQRDEHDDEGGVEEQHAVLDAADDGQDGEQDRHRAAQADPGDEEGLAVGVPERRQAEPHRDGPGDDDQEDGEADGRQGDRRELRRRREQAEHQEHDDLGEPGHALLEARGSPSWILILRLPA